MTRISFAAADTTAINTIKMLSVDAVEKANSGHPGMPMGAADYSYVLWSRYLRVQPSEPRWANRDRFVLSAGHGSMLLYSLLHLYGFGLSMDELKQFRQWGSKTPGHPEFGLTDGVEATTGPLGQGFGNGVGMAISGKMLAQRFNRPDFAPINFRVYAIVSDGDIMEGVASEAASLAGHLGLGNLIYIYDDNRITIDGSTEGTLSEDVEKRFQAYGWHTQKIDGHNLQEIASALENAQAEESRPSLILARTHIGNGAPHKHDSAEAHGSPLGAAETEATKRALGWPTSPTFLVPAEAEEVFAARKKIWAEEYEGWRTGLASWRKAHPDLSRLWDAHWNREVPDSLLDELCKDLPKTSDATRNTSSNLQQKVAALVPSLFGGSADLAGSTMTVIKNSPYLKRGDFSGRNIHFGIREHGMGAIMNGMALSGSWLPYGSTFLQFSDYVRPAIRVAALSKLQVIHIFTHDSFHLGEDGPTHQPVEHIGSLRLIPNLWVVRPADATECAAAWEMALRRRTGPTAICLTRQKIPAIERESTFKPKDSLAGAYVVQDFMQGKRDLTILSTGSELHLAVEARKLLAPLGVSTRVVSGLCLEAFAQQTRKFQEDVIDPGVPTVAIEAARGDLWYRWVGSNGLVIGVDTYTHSAPGPVIAEKLGFTPPAVVEKIRNWLNK